PVVASLSLGAARDFSVRKVGDSRRLMTLALPHGSLLIMNAGMQQRWQHALPKRARVSTARINLTFRQIMKR
ncbi:MAG: alpha-ketoglutarate-dependent dioxygenase AlkB, partial [Pseudomonadota bacterium]